LLDGCFDWLEGFFAGELPPLINSALYRAANGATFPAPAKIFQRSGLARGKKTNNKSIIAFLRERKEENLVIQNVN